MLSTFFFYGGLGVFALRVILAVIFIVHGGPKVKNLRATGEWFASVGFRPGIFWATVVGILELFGGVAILFGFFTQFVAMLFALEFAVITIWKIFARQPFKGGWELDILILAATLVLLWNGGGSYSLDRIFFAGW